MLCRLCDQPRLVKFLDLGFTPPADSFLTAEQLQEPETHYPLEVALCEKCGHVQLLHTVSPKILYQNDYPYEAGMTKFGMEHWEEFAQTTIREFSLTNKHLVVDIGSNVGALLSCFKRHGCQVTGVDPAENIAAIARARDIPTLNDFFSHSTGEIIRDSIGPARVITATNVFAHVDNLNDFVDGVLRLLEPKYGVFIFEAPYLPNLICGLQYDTIYHEHLSYLSLTPLVAFFKKHGLEIFDVQQRDIHGGSFRVFVGWPKRYPMSPVVENMLRQESAQKLHSFETLRKFADAVSEHREQLTNELWDLKRSGATIAALSAPAKGMTLLNYCRIGPELIDFVTEKSKLKIGKYTPGTHIPVLPDSALVDVAPDYALLLAWNFAAEIIKNLSDYQKNGGRFIIPIPTPKVI